MSNDWGGMVTLPAKDLPTRGKARQAFAHEWGCSFTEVKSLKKIKKVWDPLSAAEEYREERCDDSLSPCDAFDPETGMPTGKPHSCSWPKDVHDFWDESGTYCPWRDARKDDPPEMIVEMWYAEPE